jgi:hypothetical protein
VRRVVPSLLAPSVCAIVAVLAAAHAFAQPASRQTGGLRPALEDTDDLPRSEAERNARKRTKRSSGASEQGQITSYGNPPGFGASKTGFVSTNTKRRAAPGLGKGARPQSTSTATQPAPLSLTPPGVSATAGLPTSTPATVAVSSNRSISVAPVLPQRNQLVRLPDGTTTGGIAGTFNANRLTSSSATLLRRRTAAEDVVWRLALNVPAMPPVVVPSGRRTR